MRAIDELNAFVEANAEATPSETISIEEMIKTIYDFIVGGSDKDEKIEEKEEIKESED